MKTKLSGSWVVLVGAMAVACTADPSRTAELGNGDGGVCDPEHTVPVRITSGAESQVATMTMVTSATNIEITIEALPGWRLGDTYVTVAYGTSYFSFAENPTPWVDGYVSSIHFDIPLEDVGLACGDVFKLVVQMHVLETSTNVRHFASAVGSLRLIPASEGWREFYEVCCVDEDVDAGVTRGDDAGVEEGCTLTQGYWRNHDWPDSQLEIGGTNYTRADLLAYMSGGTEGDACAILGQQLIAALLNVASGASSIPAIAGAEGAFAAYCTPLGTVVHASTTTGQQLIGYSETLTDYNEGREGPGHCGSSKTPPTLAETAE